jgi:hypothetical protein
MMQKEACVTSGQFEKDCKPDDKGMKVAGEMLELYRVVETQSQALQIDSYTFIYISISRVAYMLFKQRP